MLSNKINISIITVPVLRRCPSVLLQCLFPLVISSPLYRASNKKQQWLEHEQSLPVGYTLSLFFLLIKRANEI